MKIWKLFVGSFYFCLGWCWADGSLTLHSFVPVCVSFVASSITHFIITAALFEKKNRVLKMHFLNNWYFGFLVLTGSLSKFSLPDKSELVSSCSTSSTSVFQNYAMEVQDDSLI